MCQSHLQLKNQAKNTSHQITSHHINKVVCHIPLQLDNIARLHTEAGRGRKKNDKKYTKLYHHQFLGIHAVKKKGGAQRQGMQLEKKAT
jgi:hypothetical protein